MDEGVAKRDTPNQEVNIKALSPNWTYLSRIRYEDELLRRKSMHLKQKHSLEA
jgi:hypothetical protein